MLIMDYFQNERTTGSRYFKNLKELGNVHERTDGYKGSGERGSFDFWEPW